MGDEKSQDRGQPPDDGDERRETYKGHEIVVPGDQRWKRIYIDGRPVHYGQAGGEFYLDVYAYDRAASLDEVVRRYVDHLERSGRNDRAGS